MEKSVIVIKAENGVVSYVIGQVETATKEKVEAEIAALRMDLSADREGFSLEAIEDAFAARFEALEAEKAAAISEAKAKEEAYQESILEIKEKIKRLEAVYAVFEDDISEEESVDAEEHGQEEVGEDNIVNG